MSSEKPFNPETDSTWNREPGIVIVPGSNYAKEMAKFEQFPGKYGDQPGNPYTYRAFPKMLYRAEHYNGKALCMAAPPSSDEFSNPDEFRRAEANALRFTQRCQRVVNDETEMQRAMEDGWRHTPQEAVEYLQSRDRSHSQAAAERNYDDRNMSEKAKREIKQALDDVGNEHLAEIKEKPKPRRRVVRRAKT